MMASGLKLLLALFCYEPLAGKVFLLCICSVAVTVGAGH